MSRPPVMGRCDFCGEWINADQDRCVLMEPFPSQETRLWHERCRLESERPMRFVRQPRYSVPMWELLAETPRR